MDPEVINFEGFFCCYVFQILADDITSSFNYTMNAIVGFFTDLKMCLRQKILSKKKANAACR